MPSSNKELVEYMKRRGNITQKKLENAFLEVDRKFFVGDNDKNIYGDHPLPIPSGQTISQPSTVARMTELLDVEKGNKILEIGTGSGYQAAILKKLAGKGKVISIEYFPNLAEFAKENLEKAGIDDVEIIHGDGSKGYEKEAPYDRIICTSATEKIPDPLLEQLKPRGILIIPIGDRRVQQMMKIRKGKDGAISRKSHGLFRFVPLRGEHGRNDV